MMADIDPQDLASEAKAFLLSKSWCRAIKRGYYGLGISHIFGVFYFEIEPAHNGIDSDLWVITGDLPPAYLVCDCSPDPISALENYVAEMRLWVEAVDHGRSVKDVIPVNAPPTKEYADMLRSRLDDLKKLLKRYYDEGSHEGA